MKRIWLATLAGVALLLGSTTADAWMLRCDGCNESQRMETARDFGLYQQPFFEGIVHVADFPGNALYALDLRCTRRGGINPFGGTGANGSRTTPPPASMTSSDPCIQFSVSPGTVDAAYQTAFNDLRAFWVETNGTFIKNATVSSTSIGGPYAAAIGSASAFDVVRSSALRHLIGQGIANHCFSCDLRTIPGVTIATIGGLLNIFADPTVIVTVVFPDGSRAAFVNRASFGDGRFEYQEGSARTAGDQRIPGDGDDLFGPWFFGGQFPDDYATGNEMIEHIGRLADVTWQTSRQSRGYWTISCGRIGDGQVVCTVTKDPI